MAARFLNPGLRRLSWPLSKHPHGLFCHDDTIPKVGSAVNELLSNPKLLIAILVLAVTLEIMLGQGDGGEAFFQGCLDALRRLGLW
jgi:hypothetical protein